MQLLHKRRAAATVQRKLDSGERERESRTEREGSSVSRLFIELGALGAVEQRNLDDKPHGRCTFRPWKPISAIRNLIFFFFFLTIYVQNYSGRKFDALMQTVGEYL